MKIVSLVSKNIAAVGYLPNNTDQGELYVCFTDRQGVAADWYVYHDVEPAVVLELILAESSGTYLNAYIKGTYASEKVSYADLPETHV